MINRKTPRFRFVRIGLISVIAMCLTACGSDDMTDLKDYVKKVKARPKRGIEPLPEIKTVATFVFEPEGLRNPFSPTTQSEEPDIAKVYSGITPNLVRTREELESYTLDSLRMVGTVNIRNNLWALIGAADSTIHRVKPGNYLGKNHGKIVRVLDDKVELMEIISDGPRSWQERQAAIALAE